MSQQKNQERLAKLIGLIRKGIQERGFFLLFDEERIQLLDGAKPSSQRIHHIRTFAKEHGWYADIHEEGKRVIFSAASNPVRE